MHPLSTLLLLCWVSPLRGDVGWTPTPSTMMTKHPRNTLHRRGGTEGVEKDARHLCPHKTNTTVMYLLTTIVSNTAEEFDSLATPHIERPHHRCFLASHHCAVVGLAQMVNFMFVGVKHLPFTSFPSSIS